MKLLSEVINKNEMINEIKLFASKLTSAAFLSLRQATVSKYSIILNPHLCLL